MAVHKLTAEDRALQDRNHALAIAPLPVARIIPGKSWAGALISNLDDAFGIRTLDNLHRESADAFDMFGDTGGFARWETD